jgi:hypothetical protein
MQISLVLSLGCYTDAIKSGEKNTNSILAILGDKYNSQIPKYAKKMLPKQLT